LTQQTLTRSYVYFTTRLGKNPRRLAPTIEWPVSRIFGQPIEGGVGAQDPTGSLLKKGDVRAERA